MKILLDVKLKSICLDWISAFRGLGPGSGNEWGEGVDGTGEGGQPAGMS